VTRPVHVYAIFNNDGNALYVGITVNLRRRFQEHARLAAWWPEATRYQDIKLTNHVDARTVERALIRAYQPEHNIRHTLNEPDRLGRDLA
jgi:predicted GIY-YIG superfamily endonuclease